jgi:hypothetical protein
MRDGKQRQLQTGRDSVLSKTFDRCRITVSPLRLNCLATSRLLQSFDDAAHDVRFTGCECVGCAFGNRRLLHEFVQDPQQVNHPFSANPIIPRGDSPDGGVRWSAKSWAIPGIGRRPSAGPLWKGRVLLVLSRVARISCIPGFGRRLDG